MSDEQAQDGTVGQVVTGGDKAKKLGKLLPTKKIVIASALGVILLAGVYFLHAKSTGSKDNTKSSFSTSNAKIAPYEQQLANELATAQAKVAKNKSSNVSTKQKVNDFLALAAAYMNENKPADAIKAYKDALATDPSVKVQVLGGLMHAYSADGQQAKAISIGEELLSLLKAQETEGSALANRADISGVTNDLNTLKSGAKLE